MNITKVLADAVKAGRITPELCGVYVCLINSCDETNMWTGSASSLRNIMGNQISEDRGQLLLSKLYKLGCQSFRKKGVKGNYSVRISLPISVEPESGTPLLEKEESVILSIPASVTPITAESIIDDASPDTGQAVLNMVKSMNPVQRDKFNQLLKKYGDVSISKALVSFAKAGNTNTESFLKDVVLWVGMSGDE